jgi:hypothetical protein
MIVALALAGCRSAAAQKALPPSTTFRWLDAGKDAALFERIKSAFADELKPDDPEKVKPVAAQLYKRISRIGVFETSALVLIAERETPAPTYGDYFLAINYDLKTGKKAAFEKGFMKWKFKKFVLFEYSRMPDIVFTHYSCTECEADFLLGSFRFDSKDEAWKIRNWGERNNAIMIGGDTLADSADGIYDYDCLFKFADFNGDGFDDLAVRCLGIGEQGKILEDTTTIYTVQRGQSEVIAVKDPRQLAAVREKLCTDVKKSKLCPSK